MLNIPKRAVAVHDISGFGRCSLTVALPILSCAGIETVAMPTAVLSTHTGIEGFTYRDLTEDLPKFINHWESIGLEFDSIYSGFLGSLQQIEIVNELIKTFKTDDNITLVDPAMADHGEMYPVFDKAFAKEMTKLCKNADIIVPNMTEACFLLDMEYTAGPYSKEFIENLLINLSKLGPKKIVLTGVSFKGDELGSASFDSVTDEINYAFSPFVNGFYHGTGDVFASVLLASLMNGFSLERSAKTAVDFTYRSIVRSDKTNKNTLWGVNFEAELPALIKTLGLFEV